MTARSHEVRAYLRSPSHEELLNAANLVEPSDALNNELDYAATSLIRHAVFLFPVSNIELQTSMLPSSFRRFLYTMKHQHALYLPVTENGEWHSRPP